MKVIEIPDGVDLCCAIVAALDNEQEVMKLAEDLFIHVLGDRLLEKSAELEDAGKVAELEAYQEIVGQLAERARADFQTILSHNLTEVAILKGE